MHVAVLWPLWLLAAIPLVVWSTWRRRQRAARARLLLAAALRSLALVLLALALMRPTLPGEIERLSLVYAIDVSRSVSPRGVEEALRWIGQVEARRRPDRSHVLLFGDRALLAHSPDEARARALGDASPAIGRRGERVGRDATNLEAALLAAVDGFDADSEKHLVLISDGNQTEGNLWRALPLLQRAAVHVYAIPAQPAVAVDAWPQSIALEPPRQDQPVHVHARVFSRTAAKSVLRWSIDGHRVGMQSVDLHPGMNDAAADVRFERAGVGEIELEVQAEGDEAHDNDRLRESVWVGPRPHVIHVEGNAGSAHYLAEALRRQGIEVTTASPEQLGRNPEHLLGKADVLILSDVPAAQLGDKAAGHIERFVRDRGGGLVFAAGEQTYGKEGYAGSPVERTLPVTFEGKRRRRDVDLVLLIDRSFSMRGRKLELAKSAALAALDLLEEKHRLAVIGFDAQPREVVPLSEVGNKRHAEDLIASMTASGQTSLYPALRKAQQLLVGSTAHTRHIILLSDGITAPPQGRSVSSAEQVQAMVREARADVVRRERGVLDETPAAPPAVGDEAFAELAGQLKAAHISLSTIAVGDKPNLSLMDNLADWAGGRHYAARDDRQIPGLFVAETQRLLGASIIEQSFQPLIRTTGPITDGIDMAHAPALKGFVVARAKRFSEVLLEAQKDKPLLARTQYGLGATVAFLSDAKNRWAAEWLPWPGYARLWAQMVRAVLPRDAGLLDWRVAREGGEARIRLTALDRTLQYRTQLSPKVQVGHADGREESIPLRQVAPGEYQGRVRLARDAGRPTGFTLQAGGGLSADETARAGTRALFYAVGDEDYVRPADVALLRSLSERTGGVYAPTLEQLFARRDRARSRDVDVWQYLAAAALVLYLLDIAVRRVPLPFARVIEARVPTRTGRR